MKTSILRIIAILSTLCLLISAKSPHPYYRTRMGRWGRTVTIENECNEIIQEDSIDLETIDSYLGCLKGNS